MIRTFHPVGQGAFYTEEFENFTVVYDCGSLTGGRKKGRELIKGVIKNAFAEKQRIDAVFISHLHADHVNGLEFLLEHCVVKRLFLPLIDDEEKVYLHISNVISGNNEFLDGLIEDPIAAIDDLSDDLKISLDNRCDVYLVPPIKKEDINPNDAKGIDFEKLEKENFEEQILNPNMKFIFEKIKAWVFISFNFKQEERSVELRELLKEEFHLLFDGNSDQLDVKNFKEIWENPESKAKIKELNKCISQDLNINSMTLYSGPEVNKDEIAVWSYSSKFNSCRNICVLNNDHLGISSGCFYFGDYKAKIVKNWNALFNFYKVYWKQVGVVQIPHHGSSYDYNRGINEDKSMISIISAGRTSRHPHVLTLKCIIFDGGCPLIVTDDPISIVVQEVKGTEQLQANADEKV